jgi:periplasmic protein CpxP/Spy
MTQAKRWHELRRVRIAVLFALAGSGGLVFASGSYAATDSRVVVAQSSASATPKSDKPAARPSHSERVEARIKDLHDRLKITKDEEDQFNQVAQTMRENARNEDDLIRSRTENAAKMSAVDNLKSYSDITEAHAEDVKKFLPVFQALYDKLSDDQKKTADTLFRGRGERRSRSGTASGKG